MATVRRANVILDIADDDAVISKYLGMGYDLLGANGRVEKKATNGRNAAELQKEIDELTEENKRLKGIIKKLKEAKEVSPISAENRVKPVSEYRATKSAKKKSE